MAGNDAWSRWWSTRVEAEKVPSIGDLIMDALHVGLLTPPLPGHGQTAERLTAIAAWGRADPVFARLAVGHAEAIAILAELAGPAPGDRLWSVWAEEPGSVTATPHRVGWTLSGPQRPRCLGNSAGGRALVNAQTPAGPQLFAIDVADAKLGTADEIIVGGNHAVHLNAIPGTPVGDIGRYANRPGFWHARIDVAASWLGGAQGVADMLMEAARSRDLDSQALAELGNVDVALHIAGCLVADAAARIDAEPSALQQSLALRVQLGVAAAATEVIDRVTRALGPSDPRRDSTFPRRVDGLCAYLNQGRSEARFAALGAMVREGRATGSEPDQGAYEYAGRA
jgi:hypothetical protein